MINPSDRDPIPKQTLWVPSSSCRQARKSGNSEPSYCYYVLFLQRFISNSIWCGSMQCTSSVNNLKIQHCRCWGLHPLHLTLKTESLSVKATLKYNVRKWKWRSTRESESWKLKTRLFRSPGEPRRLRDAHPLHVLWTPPRHSCSNHLHNDQGDGINKILHGNDTQQA